MAWGPEKGGAQWQLLTARLLVDLLYLQLDQSRRHEYEADELALHLGGAAGMDM